jgi:hypothetical protein
MNKADRTHHQHRNTSPEKNSRKAPGIRKKRRKVVAAALFTA